MLYLMLCIIVVTAVAYFTVGLGVYDIVDPGGNDRTGKIVCLFFWPVVILLYIYDLYL